MPGATSRFTPRSAWTPPNRTSASATCRSVIVSPPLRSGRPSGPLAAAPELFPGGTRYFPLRIRTTSHSVSYGPNFRPHPVGCTLKPMEHSMAERLAELAERKNEALNAGSPRAVERHHAKGKLTARERIEYLLDEGSFQELDMLARHRAHGMGLEDNRPYTDGVVTGFGTIDGRRVCLFSQDFTVFGGALGEVFAEKIHKVMDLAASTGVPMIGLNDGAGARIQEGVVSLHSYGGIFHRNVDGVRGDPPDQRDPRAVRRRCRLLARHDRLHLHGAGHLAHVHHRPRRGEDGDRRGRHARRARRRDEPRHQVRRRHLRRARREGLPRRGAPPAVVPARRTTSRSRRPS